MGALVGETEPTGTSVTILGPYTSCDLATAVRLAAARGDELVIISVGYPPSPRQQAGVATAIDHAIRLGVRCQAIVASAEEIGANVCPGDRVAPMGDSGSLASRLLPAGR